MNNKKRLKKIFASTLTLAAGLSLVACGKSKAPKEFTVSFATDGGSGVNDQVVKKGGTINVTPPTKAGYRFAGWFTDANLTQEFTADSKITADTTLYAKWVQQVTVTFNTNGGNVVDAITLDKGKTVTLPTVTKASESGEYLTTNYTLEGWYTDAEFATKFEATQAINANITLYANWEESTSVKEGFEFVQQEVYFNNYTKGEAVDGVTLTEVGNITVIGGTPAKGTATTKVTLSDGTEATVYDLNLSGNTNGSSGRNVDSQGAQPADQAVGGKVALKSGAGNVDADFLQNITDKAVKVTVDGDIEAQIRFTFRLNGSSRALYLVDSEGTIVWMYTEDSSIHEAVVTGLSKGDYYFIETNGCRLFYLETSFIAPESPATGIEITNKGTVDYMAGQEYDPSDLVVKTVHENGNKKTTDKFKVVKPENYDPNTAGEYTFKVVSTENEAWEQEFKVTVFGVESIELGFNGIIKIGNTAVGNGQYFNHTVQQVYGLNEELDLQHLTLFATTKNGDEYKTFTVETVKGTDAADTFAAAGVTVTGFDSTTEGVKTITVTYAGKSATFDIAVVDDTKAAKVTTGEGADAVTTYMVKADASYTGVPGAVVDGRNVFKTVQAALEFLGKNAKAGDKKDLYIAAGTYREKIEITLPYLTITGESAATTKIEWDSLYGQLDEFGFTHTTDSTQTVAVRDTAKQVTIKNLTISNEWNNAQKYIDDAPDSIRRNPGQNMSEHRALAILVQADMFTMDGCRVLGMQDTIELFTGRQYIVNTYIQGTTDYIFGTNSTTYFKDCEIKTVASEDKNTGGYITAFKGVNTSGSQIKYGAIFDGCNFTSDDDVPAESVALARPWDSYSAVVIMNSTFDGSIAKGVSVDTQKLTYPEVDKSKVTAPAEGVTYYIKNTDGTYSVTDVTAWEENVKYYTKGLPASRYYNGLSADSLNPSKHDGALLVKFFEYNNQGVGAMSDTELAQIVVGDGVRVVNTLTAEQAAEYADFTKIFGTSNDGVSYTNAWDPTSTEIAKDNNTYYNFQKNENATGTNYTFNSNALENGSAADDSKILTGTTKTLGNLTVDCTAGSAAWNQNSGFYNFKTGAKIKITAAANDVIRINFYNASYAKNLSINGVYTTTSTLSYFVATAGEVVFDITGDTYINQIIVMPNQEAPEEATVTSITVAGVPDNVIKGTDIDLTDLVVTANLSNNTAKIVTDYTTNVAELNADKDTTGDKTLTVSYAGKSRDITVKYVASLDTTISETTGFDYKSGSNGSIITTDNVFNCNNASTFKLVDKEAKTYKNVTYTGCVSNGDNNYLKINGGAKVEFDVSQDAVLRLAFYKGANNATIDLDGTPITTTSTAGTSDQTVYEYVIPAAGHVTITSTDTNGQTYLVYMEVVIVKGIKVNTGFDYKSGSNGSIITTDNVFNCNNASTFKAVDTEVKTYKDVTYTGCKSNGDNNYLKINGGAKVEFDVAAACTVKLAFYKGANNATIDLDGTPITTTSTAGTSDQTVYEYVIPAAGHVTITSTDTNGQTYLVYMELVFTTSEEPGDDTPTGEATAHTYKLDMSKISTAELTANGSYYNVEADGEKPVLAAAADLTGITYAEGTTAKYDGSAITQTALNAGNDFLTVTGVTDTVFNYRDGLKFYKSNSGAASASSNPSCVEIKGDAVKITVQGTATLKVMIASTSGSNVSTFALKKGTDLVAGKTEAAGDLSLADNVYTIKGTTYVEVEYQLTAGEYILTTPDAARNTRISSIVLVDTFAE